MIKKIAIRAVLGLLALLAVVGVFALILVGPWPVYSNSAYSSSGYYANAITALNQGMDSAKARNTAELLQAGWAEREITPEPGHPMAGYGGREDNMRSIGVHEPLYVRALALHDGNDTTVLIGSDMLQTYPNLLDLIEARISVSLSLDNGSIYYTSSHTHGGPGGLAPGRIAALFLGEYQPDYVSHLAEQFVETIEEAVGNLAPARLAHGSVSVPEYIANRARKDGPVDARLNVAAVEWVESGERLYLARYSAHATAYGQEMRKFHNDYAGAFQRAVKLRTNAPLLFMGGAMGSMRPNPPGPPLPEPQTPEQKLGFENDVESALVREGKKTLEELLRDQEARVEAMGEALADRLLSLAENLNYSDRVEIGAFAMTYDPPPAQARLSSPKWRLSPFVFNLLGVPKIGRLQVARIGDMLFLGLPYDFSGEISAEWQSEAEAHGVSLWVTSFSGAYLGYLSPDKYYDEVGPGLHYNHYYEIVRMNWFGPDQARYMTDLFRHVLGEMKNGMEARLNG